MSTSSHTPGPWRWELNLTSRVVQLCGGRPRFDKIVMDFKRWGMGSAAPRFQNPEHPHRLMTRADEFAVPVDGREHHYQWFQDIDQPDARLIAAAPDLYAALAAIINDPDSWLVLRPADLERAEEALSKAEGKS